MMQDLEAAEYVEKHLGDAFNIEDHAAIAAYLYAYYAQGSYRIQAVLFHLCKTTDWRRT